MTVRLACLLAVAAIVTSPSVVAAALARPPLEFTMSPHTVDPGRPMMIRVAPRPHSHWGSSGPLDVYVMWATGDRAAFLTPDGRWSPTPAALHRAMTSGSPAMVMMWNPQPAGELPLAMLAVPSGADPLVRNNWRFRPVLRSARVATSSRGASVDVVGMAGILTVTVLTIAMVFVVPRSRVDEGRRASPIA